MKIFYIGICLLSSLSSFASECSNEQARLLTTNLLNHYRVEFNLPAVTQDELFTERQIYSGRVLSERKVSFETVGELQDYLLESALVQETDKAINAPLDASTSIAWTLRSSLAAKNGLNRAYKKSTSLDVVFGCQ